MSGTVSVDRPRSLHVLLTADVVGGVWDFCCSLAAELTRAGHRATLLVFGQPGAPHRRQARQAGAELLAAPLKLEWMQGSADDVRAACTLTARLIRERRVDLLHANHYALGQVEAGVPVVVTAHSDVLSWLKWTRRGGRLRHLPIEWARYALLVRRGVRSADAVVAVSRFLADELRALYLVERPIPVVYNGWPAEAKAPVPLPERGRLTLLAGRAWDEAKNVQLAARAAEGWDPGRVVLAGELRHPESGEAARLGPPIETVGRVPREAVDRYLDAARVYLAPARYEPFGLLPLQAALAGCPLLLSDVPSFRELWDGAALFFRADDPRDLRRQWSRLLRDDDLASELAGRARRLARERYDVRRMAAEYLALYRELGARGWELGKTGSRRVPQPLTPNFQLLREHA